ncbi:sodium:solute symporter family protein [Halococcus sediminicola]|uniref:sodium:solute symporter family protein n=1 Tax=Halococcus sediminicola TaxID=1264579 RepID=UPI0023513846|nr:sodium:solute symporter family protein [Halococcus sediminicola]
MVLYFFGTVLVAWWFGRGAGSGYVSFTLAGKNLDLLPFTMTYFATFVGGGLTMGIAQTAFIEGISAQWYAMTQGLAWITMSLFIGFLYSFDVVSTPDLLGRVFGDFTKYFAAVFTLIGQVSLTAAQTIGMATIITTVTDISLQVGFWISAVVFIGITVWGGMNSVAWADTFHGIVIIVGMVIAIPVALDNAGGFGTVATQLPTSHTNWFGVGLVQIASWYLLYITVAGAQQHLLQRAWAAKNVRVAKYGIFLSGAVITGYGILTATAGLIANAQGATIDSSLAFAWTLQNTLPPVLAGLLLAAAVGGVMSGADSFLLAGATTFVNDLYIPLRGGAENLSETHLVRMTRGAILVFGIGAALVALSGIRIVAVENIGLGIMSVLFAGILAMLWKGTKREAGLPGFIVGGAVFVLWNFVLGEPALFGEGPLESAVPATVSALITILGVSYALPDGETFTLAEIRTAATRDMERFTGGDVTVADGGVETDPDE